jgi:hypothetical protein
MAQRQVPLSFIDGLPQIQFDTLTRSWGNQAVRVALFLKYAIQGFLDQLRRQIEKIQEYHLLLARKNYVHD